jgi:formylglycine-generating enzyme required for sulfatase activity
VGGAYTNFVQFSAHRNFSERDFMVSNDQQGGSPIPAETAKKEYLPKDMQHKDFKGWLEFFNDPKPHYVITKLSQPEFMAFKNTKQSYSTYNDWKTKGRIPHRKNAIKVIAALLCHAFENDHSMISQTNWEAYTQAFVNSPATGKRGALTEAEKSDIATLIAPSINARQQISPKALDENKSVRAGEITPVITAQPAISSGMRSRNRLAVSGIPIILAVGLFAFLYNSTRDPYRQIEHNRDWIAQQATFNGLPMVLVPKGCFNMGNAHGQGEDERKVSQQCFDKPFWISETEITQAQFGATPEQTCNTNKITKEGLVNPEGPTYPMNCVTWEQAAQFCKSKDMRLATEAEWEYAARGPDNWLYPWGDQPDSSKAILRLQQNAPGEMLPAGSKPADKSWVGAYDMLGSLREFTSSIFNPDLYAYPYSQTDGRESLVNTGNSSINPSETTLRVIRGKSFDDPAEKASLTYRDNEWYDFLFNFYGIRCAKDY